MKIRVSSNASEVSAWMRGLFRDQVPFALSKAINETAKEAQRAQRRHQASEFTIRRKRFADAAVKIKPFSSKRRLFADVQIDPPGSGKADILTKFEDQSRKRPRGSRIAIPTPSLKRTGTGIVPPSMRPSRLNFQQHGGDVFRGDKRTFMILRPGGTGAIFRRRGRRGSTGADAIFVFRPSADISGTRLAFERTVTDTVRRTFDRHFSQAFDLAVQTAR